MRVPHSLAIDSVVPLHYCLIIRHINCILFFVIIVEFGDYIRMHNFPFENITKKEEQESQYFTSSYEFNEATERGELFLAEFYSVSYLSLWFCSSILIILYHGGKIRKYQVLYMCYKLSAE